MFTFKIIPDDGEAYDLEAKARDVLRWERGGRNRSVGKLRESMSFVELFALAHAAATRQGTFVGPLADFEAGNDFEMVGDDEDEEQGEAGDPTRPAP